MLVLRISAMPGAIRKMPPGPGIGAIAKPAITRRMPRPNRAHSTSGLSKNRRHCSRLVMRGHVVAGALSRKALAPTCGGGLASGRRARGKSDQQCAFVGRGLMAATVATVAYLGLEARAVEVQVQL